MMHLRDAKCFLSSAYALAVVAEMPWTCRFAACSPLSEFSGIWSLTC